MNIETMLPPFRGFVEDYNRLNLIGEKYFAQQKIVLLGLVRNLESKLENNIQELVKLLSNAKDYKIVLFENDSIDNTKTILKKITSENNNIIVISQDYNRKHFGATKERERTEALAEYRNILQNYVNENFSDFDFVIVSDIDFVDFSRKGVYNTFGWFASSNDIDASAGNAYELKHTLSQKIKTLWNYDSWAYRGSWWNYLQYDTEQTYFDNMLWFNFYIPPVGSIPTKVYSAFGGMTIYKTKKYLQAQYEGHDCEHVCLHYNLFKSDPNFNLMLNPSQIMLM